MTSDLRFALRRLRRSPAFTVTAITTLALTLGASIALFAVVDAVLLRPLDYPAPERLITVRNRVDGIGPSPWGLSQAQYFDYETHASTLEGIGVYVTNELAVADAEGAERVPTASVSPSLFEVLRVRPAVGRLFREDDVQPGMPAGVAVLGHAFWSRRFGGDPTVIGRFIDIDTRPREIVGVLPPGFDLPDGTAAIWFPLQLDRNARPVNSHFLHAVARLQPTMSIDQVRAELEHLVNRYPEIFPSAYDPAFMRDSRFAPEVLSLHEAAVGDVKRALWVLFGAAGVVLLIACANLANLFLVRAQDRWHELQVRTALGAEPRHLLGHALAEALLIALVAGALGIYVADTALRVLLEWDGLSLPRLERIGFGWRAALFAAALSIVTGIALGLAPMIRMRRIRSVHAQLHRGLTASRDAVRARNGLVVGQVALAVVLLAAAGLMGRSYQNLGRVAPGFDPDGVLAINVSLPAARYPAHHDASRFYEALLERVRGLPGVMSAGATSALPLTAAGACAALFIEDAPLRPNENPPCVPVRRVTPGYFQALGIPVDGTTPDWLDVNAESAGVVVTRALAERLWPGQDALGKGIRGNGWTRPFYRVVGVAGNVREAGLDKPPVEAAYFPMIPMDGAPLWTPARAMTLVVRTQSEDPTALAGAVRGVLNELDRSIPLGTVSTMARIVEQSIWRTTLVLLLLGIAAGLGLLLATIGLYGVLAYTVSRKRKEIGIRTALGGARSQIASRIVRESLALTGTGIAAGVIVAALTTSVLENMLFGISAVDPLTFAGASVLLILTALMASYIPARRAASVDPMLVLRTD